MGVDVGGILPYLSCMRKQKRIPRAASEAGAALAARRMVKMTPEQRSQVARLGGYAKAQARKEREAEEQEPEAVSA